MRPLRSPVETGKTDSLRSGLRGQSYPRFYLSTV